MTSGISTVVSLRSHARKWSTTCVLKCELLFQFASLSETIDEVQYDEEKCRTATNNCSQEDFLVHNPHFLLLPFRGFDVSLIQEFIVDLVKHIFRWAKFIVAHIEEWCLDKAKIFGQGRLCCIEVEQPSDVLLVNFRLM